MRYKMKVMVLSEFILPRKMFQSNPKKEIHDHEYKDEEESDEPYNRVFID